MKRIILKGSTDQTLDIYIQDSSSTTGAGKTGLAFNTASLVCYYRRGATGTATALTLATQTVGGAHSDGGFVEIDATNMPGAYRLDLSDAIVATGVPYVTILLKGAANMAPCPIEIQLVDFDPQSATSLGLSNLDAAVTTRLAPTVAGRTLDVSAGGNAGIDWANVESPTTALNLSGTNIDPDQVVASVTGAVGSVTGAVGSVTGSVGSVTGAVGSVTGNVGGNVVGSVGSVVAAVTAALNATGLDAVLIESGIIASAALTNDTGTQLTEINARQALALQMAALAGVLAGAATTSITIEPGGNAAGNTRVTATVDANGNRSALTLVVPD